MPRLAILDTGERRATDIVAVGGLVVLAVGGLSATFERPWLAAAAMLGVLGLTLWRWHSPADLLIASAGLVFGPLNELFATQAGLWTYAFPTLLGLPAWVFTLWPAFPVCLFRLAYALAPTRLDPAKVPGATELLLGVGLLAVEIPWLCLLGTDHPTLATAGTLALMVPALAFTRSRQAAWMLLVSAFMGPFCEAFVVARGAWSYPTPAFLGLPLWLPTGYALFGFALVRLGLGALGLLAGSRGRALSAEPATAQAPARL